MHALDAGLESNKLICDINRSIKEKENKENK